MSEEADVRVLQNYVTIKEAAEMLGLAYGTVHEYVTEGRFHSERVGNLILIPVDEIEKFKPNIAGRPRTSIPLWRISPTDNALLYISMLVQVRNGKLDDFRRRLDELRRKKEHLFPGTIARYVLGSSKAPGHVEIVLVWRISVMPDETARELALEEFKKALEDVVDWDTAQFDEGSVFMHA